MNERIKELADKSGLYIAYDNREVTDKELEFFAELIVRECVDCALGAGLADDVAVRNGLGFNDGILEAVTHIKKHLGVEE